MDNIISLAARVVRKPQPATYYPIDDRPASRQAREMCILEQLRIWFLASEESPAAKEAFLRQYKLFMEPRV